ncbi:MAG TPA: amidase [Streptosporangiaceae bacterium]|nr:amidase [Streptosporangiaceae bacterium]
MSTWIIRETAAGPGLRVAVKDLIDVAGQPTTAASRAVAERATPAEADAACLAGLRAAIGRGEASLAGKVNLHELAYGISGVNAAFGTPVNPLDPGLVPGGSSSGSAVAVAAGEADVAYGTDTGGSIRIPAACCGVTGLKTTWGRIPLTGVWPLAPSMDTVGPLARDVAGVIAGMALLEPGFAVAAPAPVRAGRVAMPADPAVDQAIDNALASVGWDVERVTLPGLAEAMMAAMTVLDAEAWASDGALAQADPGRIGGDVLMRLREASRISTAALGAARREGERWRAALAGLWQRVDLLALPTLLGFPPALGDAQGMARIRGLTSPVNLAGLPALALPVPARGPLPASVQLIGPAGGEEQLLAAGAVLERAVRGLSGLAIPLRPGRRDRRRPRRPPTTRPGRR